MPEETTKDKGKSTAALTPAGPQFVSLDQLVAILQQINKPREEKPEVKTSTSTDRAVALADALAKYQKLGKAIEPHLAEYGVNFPDWELSLRATVARVFESPEYFKSTAADNDGNRAALTGVLVEHSVHPSLVSLVRGKTGRLAFAVLQSRIANVSWTYIMSRWAKASDSADIYADLNSSYSEMQTCLDEIEKWVGTFSKDLVLALLVHQRCHPHFQGIVNALDARIAVNPNCTISSKTILEIAGCMNSSLSNTDSSVFAFRTARGGKRTGASGRSGGRESQTMEGKSATWARRVLNEKNPCCYCFEWGHWMNNCPLKKERKPPVGDPRLLNPNVRLKRSAVCHPALLQGASSATVASVEKQPGGEGALLDSGAMDSVSNNIGFP